VSDSAVFDQSSSPKREASSFLGSGSPSKNSAIISPRPIEVGDQPSASTLQHSILTYNFPKANRFPPINKTLNESQNSISLPSTLGKKSTSFGYGHKILMSEIVMKNGWDIPASNVYCPKEWTEGDNKGKSFGISYEAYRKVYNPASDITLPEIAREIPGPGQYPIASGFGDNKGKSATLKAKGKMFNEMFRSEAPAANHYCPNLTQVEPSRFKGTNFGYGGRSDFTKDGGLSPGPGSYKIASKFDQYTQRKIMEERLREKLKVMKMKST